MCNPISSLTRKEWTLWIGSLAVVMLSNMLAGNILWVFASLKNPAYLPVTANFMIFFFNDLYGFVS